MLTVKNISKSFGANPVLKDISMEFEKKKIYTIIGGSGHGKTVLLKCIIGLLTPEMGKVLYNKKDFFEIDQTERQDIRKSMGVVFQGNALFDSMTIEENIIFPLNMFTDWDETKKRRRVDEVLKSVNLAGINQKFPSELSGGMKKRAAIARAIVTKPDYIFFDEPNSGLDPYSSRVIDELIFNYIQANEVTCLINTHDMNTVRTISDEIVFIEYGQLKWKGSTQQLQKIGEDLLHVKEFVFGRQISKKVG